MKTTKKILLFSSLILFAFLLAAAATLTYLVLHPEKVKDLVEESLSSALGADLTIGTLTLSMDPLVLSSSDIQVKQKSGGPGFVLDIPTLSASMALQGPLGRRTLALKELSVPQFSLVVSGGAELPRIDTDSGAPSPAKRMAVRLLSLLLFKDIRLERGSIGDGSVLAEFRDGSIRLRGIHAVFQSFRPMEVACSAEVRLLSGESTIDLPHLQITGPETLSLVHPLEGKLLFKEGSIKAPAVKASGFSGSGHFKVESLNTIEFEPLHLTASSAATVSGDREISLEAVRISLQKGVIDIGRRAVSIPEITITSMPFGELRAALAADAGVSRITLAAEKLGLGNTLEGLDLLPGWRFSGEHGLHGRAVIDRTGWSFSGDFTFQGVDFQDPTGSHVGDGVVVGVSIAGKGHTDLPSSFRYSARIEKGEILTDRTYFDLSANSFRLSGDAELETAKDRGSFTFNMSLGEILSLSGRTALQFRDGEPSLQLLIHVPENPIRGVFRHFFLEPYKNEIPLLREMSASGSFSTDMEISVGPEWSLRGRLRLLEGVFSIEDPPLRLQNVRLDLPFLLGKVDPGATPEGGMLQIESMELPFLPVQPLDVKAGSGPNSLYLEGPISLDVPGGTVRIGPIRLDSLADGPTVHTTLSIEGVDLDPILSKIWGRSVGGRLTGKLNPVHYSGGAVTATGALKADLFGGVVVLEDLGITGLSSIPVLSLNGRWEEISLLELSRDTSFGRIQGVLRGHVNDLEIARMQPQRFELFMETVPKSHVPQKISIAAVDNIARIGGGQSPFSGAAGLLSALFREFTYSKIGIRAALENDTFRINGTIKEGGVEYLVKRGSFSGVNVVNQNPDNRISFRDMLKRIQRIGSSGSGPVIR